LIAPRPLAGAATLLVLALASAPASGQLYAVQPAGLAEELTCIGISPKDPNFVMVGTAEGKVLRTVDGGATWEAVIITPVRSMFYGRERQPDPRLEYALGLPGKSPHLQSWLRRQGLTTSGINVAQLLMQTGEKSVAVNWIDMSWGGDSTVFVGTLHGLYKSTDRGRTFSRVFQGYAMNYQGQTADRVVNTVATDPAEPRRLMVGTASGLFISRDNGNTFRKVDNYYLLDAHVREIWFDREQKGLVHLAMAGSAMASPDAGQHWVTTHWHDNNARADVLSMSLGPQNIRLIGTRDGVYASWQGGEMGTWRRSGFRFIGSAVSKVLATDNPKMWLALTDAGMWLTEDAGLNWRKVFQAGGKELPRSMRMFGRDPRQLWFITNRQIYRIGPPPAMRRYDLSSRAAPTLLRVPLLADLVVRVLRHNRIHFADNQATRSRSFWAAFLPSITAGYHYAAARDTTSIQQNVRLPGWPWTFHNASLDKGSTFEVIANWELGRLLFDRARLPHFGRIERNLAALRQDISEKVHRLYMEYRRVARILVYAPPAHQLVREYHEIRLQEIAAYLDAMSGGYWSKATGGEAP
jgi:photosystem II stability/assembly factor-like uncharacterized protein